MRRLREEFEPDLKGGYPFLQTRRNELQVHVPALREALAEARDGYGVAVPDPADDGFYAELLERAVATTPAATA